MLCDTHRHLALTNSDCPGCLQARVEELEAALFRIANPEPDETDIAHIIAKNALNP